MNRCLLRWILVILMGLALAVLSCEKESGVNGGGDDNTQKPLTDPSIPMMSDWQSHGMNARRWAVWSWVPPPRSWRGLS